MTDRINAADETRAFLRVLWPKPAPGELALWRRQDKKTLGWYRTDDLDVLADDSARHAKSGDLYLTVYSHERAGGSARGNNETARAMAAVASDVDFESDAHPDAPPREYAEAVVAALPLAPTLVVETGNGQQLWWAFVEPWALDTAEARHAARALVAGWLAFIRGRMAPYGLDAVDDLARVLRVPGTMNLKDKDNPKPVVLREVHPERRYTVADFERYRAAPSIERTRTPAPGDDRIFRLGARHAALLSLAGRLRAQGLGTAAIRDVLLAFNDRQCDPPQSRADVERIARDAGGWAPGVPGARPCITLPANLEESTALVLARLAELEAPSPTLFAWADGIAELGRAEDGAVRLDRLWSKDKLREAIGRRFDFEHWVRAKQPRTSTPKVEAANG